MKPKRHLDVRRKERMIGYKKIRPMIDTDDNLLASPRLGNSKL